jgi:hypothetical protein
VLATLVAWAIHGESLAAVQMAGGLLVVAAVAWVQTHAPADEVEAVPAWGVERASKDLSRRAAANR